MVLKHTWLALHCTTQAMIDWPDLETLNSTDACCTFSTLIANRPEYDHHVYATPAARSTANHVRAKAETLELKL